jgi:hypothetical protein
MQQLQITSYKGAKDRYKYGPLEEHLMAPGSNSLALPFPAKK